MLSRVLETHIDCFENQVLLLSPLLIPQRYPKRAGMYTVEGYI